MLILLKASLNLILLSAYELFFLWPPSFGFGLCTLYPVWKTLILIPVLCRLYQGPRSVWFQSVTGRGGGRWGWSVCICGEWSVCWRISSFPESASLSLRPELSSVSGLRRAKKLGESTGQFRVLDQSTSYPKPLSSQGALRRLSHYGSGFIIPGYVRKVNEEIPRCLITLLRALLETWSPGFFYICASVRFKWAELKTGRKGKEIGKTMLLASGPQGLWRDSRWKERHRDGGKGHPGHARAWLPLQSPSPTYDFLQPPLVGTNYGNHGKVLFLERTFRRAWPGRSRAGKLEGTVSTTESLWADLCGSWGCPSCALPAPYLICTCTYLRAQSTPPVSFLSDNSFPICENSALEGVTTNVKEVKTGAESVRFVKWTTVFSPFPLSTLTVHEADLIMTPV